MALREDRFLPAGTSVRLDSYVGAAGDPQPEYGTVVHCWLDEAGGFYDCYVAFFEHGVPDGKPIGKPYVLRYASAVLTAL